MNTIRVSNSLDPDQARRFVGPDLGSNCFRTALKKILTKNVARDMSRVSSGSTKFYSALITSFSRSCYTSIHLGWEISM